MLNNTDGKCAIEDLTFKRLQISYAQNVLVLEVLSIGDRHIVKWCSLEVLRIEGGST